jgi:uncharacterized protein (UPF0333 family)
MDSSNNRGQILIEVSIVFLMILLIFFAALKNFQTFKVEKQKYQFNQDNSNEKLHRKISRSRFK